MAPSNVRGILLWGGKSKTRVIVEMLKEQGFDGATKLVIFDDTLKNLEFECGHEFVGNVNDLKLRLPEISHFIVCIGNDHGYARVKTAEYLAGIGLNPLGMLSPHCYIDESVIFGSGIQVMPSAVVHKFTEVGSQVIINTNATIDHECFLGNGVHIMGSAAIAGKVSVGNYATIGTNATILPYLNIGEGAYVGAGAVVTKNVDPYTVVAGVPARMVKKYHPSFHEFTLIELSK